MDLTACFKEIEGEKERMIERVIEWSHINSHSFNLPGLQRMASTLMQAFSALDCEHETIALSPIDEIDHTGVAKKIELGPLLRFWKRKEAPFKVLLVGHMDTVFGKEHPFQQAMRLSANRVNGPGVADMKGGLCVLLEALKQFEKYYPDAPLGWEVLINPDEEVGSLGSAPYLRERALAHDVGLLFEPAMDEMGTLAGIRKGSGRFVVIVHGHAAHAGRDFEEGRNAIVLLSTVIMEIHALNGQRPGVTINVGQIEGGGSVNVVPALAICRIDVRIQSESDVAWVTESVEKIVIKANQSPGFLVEYQGNFNRKPKALTGKTEALYDLAYAVGQEIGQTIAWKPSGGCCDGNNLALPNIDTLGVSGGKIHSDAEYILTDSLVERTKLTVALLLKLSQGLPILKRTSF